MAKKKSAPPATPVAAVVALVKGGQRQKSLRVRDPALDAVVTALIDLNVRFTPPDLGVVAEFAGSKDWWEHLYGRAVRVGNVSFCRAYEEDRGRPPFVYRRKRLYVGETFLMTDKRLAKATGATGPRRARVTGFGEDHRGPYVTAVAGDYNRLQARHSVAARYKLTREDLKAIETATYGAAPVRRDPLFLDIARTLSDEALVPNYCPSPSRRAWKTARTLKEYWETEQYGTNLRRWLAVFGFPVSYADIPLKPHESSADTPDDERRLADAVRALVGDFDANMLPLVKKKLAPLTAAWRDERSLKRLENLADRAAVLAGL